MLSVMMALGSKASSAACRAAIRACRRARQLAEDDGAAAAVEDAPGFQVVGAKVDEGADGVLLADDIGDQQFVEAILDRDDIAVGGQVRGEAAHGGFRVLCLDAEQDGAVLARLACRA